ncbi:TRAP transporter small permease subunit [Phaeobacter sp. HF9A]|uniref:TRAP transporter small permease subunit n=1 Tax=Phaeobacter sp. HF9A TaxID=2721561 RepID=UPI001431E69D|nr:TRAP transporter small permease [Phaeobacter sp. HF9A]NIZ13031.1 TRAP transporter small permease [Phaeobacter sp. HF9A]
MSDLSMRAAPEAGRLGRIIDKGGYVFAAGIVLAAGILLLEVFLRYVFNSPTLWAHETTTFLCGLAFLYGGLFCVSRNSHIRVVLIYDVIGPRGRRCLNVAISLLSLIASGFFAFACWIMVSKSFWTPSGAFRMETSGSAWNPPTPALVKGFLLLMLIAMAVQFLILALNYLRAPVERASENDA